MVSFAFILFILLALALVAGGSYKLYGMSFTKGAILFGIGALYFSVLYGIRWFGSDQSPFATPSGSWPPVINMCPDFLSYYERTKGGKKVKTCIDRMGISRTGMISVFPSSGPAPTDDKYYFNLEAAGTDPATSRNAMCQSALTAGLTWEGITNGESCVQADGKVGPLSSDGAEGANCQCP